MGHAHVVRRQQFAEIGVAHIARLDALFVQTLQDRGILEQLAHSGMDAVGLLEQADYDLLLTDIVMPGMDGIELAQQAGSIVPDLRVMFITGFSAVALRGGSRRPDAKILSKPFHLRDLVQTVAARRFSAHFKAEFDKALATAR